MSLAAALLLASAGVPQSGASLDAAAFAAFDRHCAALDSMDALSGRIAAAGWSEFTPAPGSDLAILLGFAAEAAKDIPDFTVASRAFAPKGNQALVAVVTTAGIPSMSSLECRIVAIEAAAPPSAQAVSAWAKKPADESFAESSLTAWRWTPGLKPTHTETSIAFVPKDSPLRDQVPVLGLIVQASRETRP